jgi:hypothetical protein
MKNFSNTLVVLVTTIPALEAPATCNIPEREAAPKSSNRLKEAPENHFSGAPFNVVYPVVRLKFFGMCPSIFSLPYFFRISSISLGLVFKHFSPL